MSPYYWEFRCCKSPINFDGLFNKIDEVFLFVIKINQWVEALNIDLR
jgi:hypothetical protein